MGEIKGHSAMFKRLPSTINAPGIQRHIRGAAYTILRRRNLDVFFEHGGGLTQTFKQENHNT